MKNIIANFIMEQLGKLNIKLLHESEYTFLLEDIRDLEATVGPETLTVSIKLDPDAILPTQPYETDACWDLYSLVDIWLRPGESTYIPTGISIDIPIGYEGELKARSSFGKIGLSLHHGAFDAGYQGEIAPFMYNGTSARYEVKKGERIAQFCLRKKVPIIWKQVDKFTPSIRGNKGHGSSGK